MITERSKEFIQKVSQKKEKERKKILSNMAVE